MTSEVSGRVTALRALMEQHQLDYYYVPSVDAHANEYVPACWERRAWISGFTGSSGDALVGKTQALLWTDSRYFIQADTELDAGIFTLMKLAQGQPVDVPGWLIDQGQSVRVGVDPRVMIADRAVSWIERLAPYSIELVALDDNLVDAIWSDRPAIPFHSIALHSFTYTGMNAVDKLAWIRQVMTEQSVDAHVVTALDAIAWLYNIRGRDIAYNPLVISYAVITHQRAMLFLGCNDLSLEQKDYFQSANIDIYAYDDLSQQLSHLSGAVLLDGYKTTWWLMEQLLHTDVQWGVSPIDKRKSVKNAVEQAGAREAHRRDGLCMIRFWRWLELNWQGQSEHTIAEQLDQMRLSDAHCHEMSFPAICGYADHGAVIHYRHDPVDCHQITGESLLLLDSGGQYDFGTTDITRVFHFLEPTAQQRAHYTLVLLGHLAFKNTVFPRGKTNKELDQVARWPLWRHELDFGHGVSHGVGSYLCVHEGVHTSVGGAVNVPLEPGMIVTNEPGLYVEGEYGIRIENCVLVTEVSDASSTLTGHGPFYGFEDLTVVPYNKALMDLSLMTPQEIGWVDAYHQQVWSSLCDDLTEDEREWLAEKTAPLVVV